MTKLQETGESVTRLFRRTSPFKVSKGKGGLCGANGEKQKAANRSGCSRPDSLQQTCKIEKIELDPCGASIQIRCWTGNKAERRPWKGAIDFLSQAARRVSWEYRR